MIVPGLEEVEVCWTMWRVGSKDNLEVVVVGEMMS